MPICTLDTCALLERCNDVMSNRVATASESAQRAIGESRPKMLKATLPKRESADSLKELGECLDCARRSVGWTVDQLSRELERDSKQVARWMRGEERTQVDVVFGVQALRAPFVIALARLAKCEVETTVRIRVGA